VPSVEAGHRQTASPADEPIQHWANPYQEELHVPCPLFLGCAPINRQRAVDLIRREVAATRQTGLSARLLVPLTRGHGGAALQLEVELSSLDQLDQFCQRGVGSGLETADWMQSFGKILVAPPAVEILRVDDLQAS
jgi:hypothetical protein